MIRKLILTRCPAFVYAVMKERIKVEGKAGNLGDAITVSKEGDGKLVVESKIPLSKRLVKLSLALDILFHGKY